MQAAQRVVGSLFQVAVQVVVGIQQVDVFAQMKADAAQLRGPVVLLVVEQFRHQVAKAAGHGVQIFAALGLVLRQPVQTGADGAALPWPAFGGCRSGGGEQRLEPQPQQAAVIVPLVLCVVVVERNAQVGAVIGWPAGTPAHLPDGVDGAVVCAGVQRGLAIVQAGEQQIQKGQVIAQGQPPAQAVQRTDAAAEPAVG